VISSIVVKHISALRDLDKASSYIQRQSGPERAIQFLRNAEITFSKLASRPRLGAIYENADSQFQDLRVFSVSRFKNYLVFYRPIDDGIEVLRVLHGARDIQNILAQDDDSP
jgi:toxin ParE1/3/4